MAPSKHIHDYLQQHKLPESFLNTPESCIEEPAEALDDSHPLSHYFISSSHNTYLSGNQLYGKATPEAYVKALDWGFRCVEIDVWDGVDHSTTTVEKLTEEFERLHKPHSGRIEPRVLHGHTATKECSFRDVVKTIGAHAFSKSDLPLIISLELHTNAEQQQLMVDIMNEYWSAYLVPSAGKDHTTPLPSLSSLRNKILIKVKYADPLPSAGSKEAPHPASHSDESGDESHPLPAGKSAVIPALGSMGVYTRSVHFKSFSQPEAKLPTHVFSLSEAKISALSVSPGPLIAHNKEFLLRAYPKGARVDSSNLDPAPLWRLGVQMAALNAQSVAGAPIMLNHALFSGTQGYVLKPAHAAAGTLELSITLFAADDIPHKAYVKLELHADEGETQPGKGLPDEGRAREGTYRVRSAAVADGDWRGEKLSFTARGVTEELTFLRMKVMHDELLRDEMLGWACYRLSRVRQGMRLIKLRDAEGREKGGLLVNVEKRFVTA